MNPTPLIGDSWRLGCAFERANKKPPIAHRRPPYVVYQYNRGIGFCAAVRNTQFLRAEVNGWLDGSVLNSV